MLFFVLCILPNFSAVMCLQCVCEKANNVVSKVSVNGGAKELRKVDVHSFWGGKQDELYSWSAANKEAEALIRLNERTSCSSSLSGYSNVKKSSKG